MSFCSFTWICICLWTSCLLVTVSAQKEHSVFLVVAGYRVGCPPAATMRHIIFFLTCRFICTTKHFQMASVIFSCSVVFLFPVEDDSFILDFLLCKTAPVGGHREHTVCFLHGRACRWWLNVRLRPCTWLRPHQMCTFWWLQRGTFWVAVMFQNI